MSLNGIDISNWQKGIDLSTVPADFVIVKVTEGTSYVSPDSERQIKQAKQSGKLLGVYHYANGGDVKAEAEHFLTAITDNAILFLDWESRNNKLWNNSKEIEWVTEWLEYVYKKTGRKPVLYIGAEVYDKFKNLSCELWVARYRDTNETGYQSKPWKEDEYNCLIRQYSSFGKLKGYSGHLDLDKFYGAKKDWEKRAKVQKTGNTLIANGQRESILYTGHNIAVDGIAGTETREQKVRVLQTAMNADYKAGLTVDGQFGNKSSKALGKHYVKFGERQQMVKACQILLYMNGYDPNGVDGVFGNGTLKAVKQFQKDKQFTVDGVCGRLTFLALIK